MLTTHKRSNNRRKIAVVTRDYHARGGVERVSQFYARGMADKGHEVHVWCAKAEPTEADANLVFHQLKTHAPDGWLHWFLFPFVAGWSLRAQKYDGIIVMGIAALCPRSLVVSNSVHRAWFKKSLSKLNPTQLRWWLKLLNPLHPIVMFVEWLQYKVVKCKRVIAVSTPIRQELVDEYAFAEQDIALLPNGASTAYFKPDMVVRNKTRSELGLQDPDIAMCMLVNELERKGVVRVLDAMSELKDVPLKLLLVTGKYKEATKLVAEKNLQDKVILLRSTSDTRPYLWASDLYILPTQYEAWNLSIMEAHAAGLPIVTTKLGQADLVIEHGKTGRLLEDPFDSAELNEAIMWFVDHPAKSTLADAARQRAEAYNWPKLIDTLESYLNLPNRQTQRLVHTTTAGKKA